ncbi:MAG: thiolase domain-containing protein [Archaeoglobaceae archaeon]|nr:thiolase domain-containing protein [Archaeoglobaceae archaeon]MDW7989863.1 thiolase domain-containing protein [Archaeoglobaceae archaeon]
MEVEVIKGLKFHKKQDVAIVGAGMTAFKRRMLETGKELSYYAVKQALEEAGLDIKDVEMVVLGSAPDAFDGISLKEEYLLEGAGGCDRPYMRYFVGGGTAVFAPIAGYWHVASGLADVCLVVCEEKMSCCQPHPQSAFKYIWDPILDRPLKPNLIWIFALEMRRYMHVNNVKHEDIALVSVKNKANALDHPCSHVAGKITVEDVLNSEPMALPVRRLDVSPPSDGAAALVMVAPHIARQLTDDPVWVTGVGWNLDTTHWTNRDLYFPRYTAEAARMAYRMAHITDPRKQIDVAEPYDPFDYKELHHMEGLGLAKKGEAPILTKEGVTARDGDLPVCPSGGLLGVGNPISAAMGVKVCEIYWQLAYRAGKRQVAKEVTTGICQAWGDLMQIGTVMVMSNKR